MYIQNGVGTLHTLFVTYQNDTNDFCDVSQSFKVQNV